MKRGHRAVRGGEKELLEKLGRDGWRRMDAPDLLVKDAFLVLRALCKLSMKPLGAESERDMRSQAMRSTSGSPPP